MLKIKCDKCGKILKEAGALVFSPPETYNKYHIYDATCSKYHICVDCWFSLIEFICK